jgi:hypothetical protein
MWQIIGRKISMKFGIERTLYKIDCPAVSILIYIECLHDLFTLTHTCVYACMSVRIHCYVRAWGRLWIRSFFVLRMRGNTLFCACVFESLLNNNPSHLQPTVGYCATLTIFGDYICFSLISCNYLNEGARGSAVGWGTALQVGRLRVRFPMV